MYLSCNKKINTSLKSFDKNKLDEQQHRNTCNKHDLNYDYLFRKLLQTIQIITI